jgi:hypothetical protein
MIWIALVLIALVFLVLYYVYTQGKRKHENEVKGDDFNVRPKDEFEIEFKISFPLKNGEYRETSSMKINVTAESPQQAKKKVVDHVMSKVQVTVTNHRRII